MKKLVSELRMWWAEVLLNWSFKTTPWNDEGQVLRKHIADYYTEKIVALDDPDEDGRYHKSSFMTFFDGTYGVEAEPNTPSTYHMGLCGLDYSKKDHTLTVHLRRPGILIGKGGHLIKKVSKHIGCKIDVKEVNI